MAQARELLTCASVRCLVRRSIRRTAAAAPARRQRTAAASLTRHMTHDTSRTNVSISVRVTTKSLNRRLLRRRQYLRDKHASRDVRMRTVGGRYSRSKHASSCTIAEPSETYSCWNPTLVLSSPAAAAGEDFLGAAASTGACDLRCCGQSEAQGGRRGGGRGAQQNFMRRAHAHDAMRAKYSGHETCSANTNGLG